jgi:hypothetical protein
MFYFEFITNEKIPFSIQKTLQHKKYRIVIICLSKKTIEIGDVKNER